MPHFIHDGITSTCVFSSSAHKYPAHLSIIGGAFLLESIIWCARIVRYPEFGGCLLFVSNRIADGASTVVHYMVHCVNGGSTVYLVSGVCSDFQI